TGKRQRRDGEHRYDDRTQPILLKGVADPLFEWRDVIYGPERFDRLKLRANGADDRRRLADSPDEKPGKRARNAVAKICGGDRFAVDAELSRVADNAADPSGSIDGCVGCEVQSDGGSAGEVGIREAAVDHHVDGGSRPNGTERLRLTELARHHWYSRGLEIAGRDVAPLGDHGRLGGRAPFDEMEFRGIPVADARQRGGCRRRRYTRQRCQFVERVVDALDHAIVVPDLVVTAAHVKGQYVPGVESRIHARQLVEAAEKE